MRKLLLAAAAATVLVPSMVSAQSASEVRHDQREVNQDKRKVNHDVARGNFDKAIKDQRETREDQRELRSDWKDYRRSHRDTFHRAAFRGPRGWTYRPLRVGASLDRAFWGSSYRINNWSTYRLPRPGRNLAYVRYGNDVLLVNIRTGRVIQVFSSFFW